MEKIDAGSIIVVMCIILVFLLVIIGMLTKCGKQVADFLNETTIATSTNSELVESSGI